MLNWNTLKDCWRSKFAPGTRTHVTLLFLCAVPLFSMIPSPAQACCFSCAESSCDQASDFIEQAHEDLRQNTKDEFDDDLDAYEDWWIEIMFEGEFVPAASAMVTQMSAVAMSYTEIIGMFLDAQTQLDTQRLYRQLQFEAHQDYQPSESFCMFGTNVRSLAATGMKARYNALGLSRINLERQLGSVNMSGSEDPSGDYQARWQQFITTYCDYRDNNYLPRADHPERTGLYLACEHGGGNVGAESANRMNRDIDYTRLIEWPRTLEFDMTPGNGGLDADYSLPTVGSTPYSALMSSIDAAGDEEDVIAMSRNLYGNTVLSRSLSQSRLNSDMAKKAYLALRTVVAKRSVAQASFNAIVGLKSAGTSDEPGLDSSGNPQAPVPYPPGVLTGSTPVVLLAQKQTRSFLASIMNQLLPADPTSNAGNIFSLIGHNPSYFSQLEILAKRIYQNPDFYADLYESPTNVARKKVAMKAIELMVDREIYESQLRREMSVSVLLASKLRASHRSANRSMTAGEGTFE